MSKLDYNNNNIQLLYGNILYVLIETYADIYLLFL